MKPYSESCDQNRDPILKIIQPVLTDANTLLEIGSGTGQHAVYFAQKMPHITWQTSDQQAYHAGIQAWIEDKKLPNVLPPIPLNVVKDTWPTQEFDAIYSANTCHIMHWADVLAFFDGVGKILKQGGVFLLYGPFKYHGQYTSESNARFEQWLKQRDPLSGLRDFEALNQLAKQAGLMLIQDVAMPANNQLLHWKKI